MLRNPVGELESVVALDEAVLVTVRPLGDFIPRS
jgi:hypothetical protein